MNPSEDIRDLKPTVLVELPTPLWVWVTLGVAVLVVCAFVFWWWRRLRPQPAHVSLRAHDVALAALEGLRTSRPADAAAARRFHFELSAIVRAYVEGRFELNATDLTSEEILARLSSVKGLTEGDRARLRDILSITDRVKFASHYPSAEENDGVWETARNFVLSTLSAEAAA